MGGRPVTIALAEQHPALHAARKEQLQTYFRNALYWNRERVHSLTRAGYSQTEIAEQTGLSSRHVARLATKPELPDLPTTDYTATDERVEDLEAGATLAVHLVGLLRDEDPALTWSTLSRLSRWDLQQLAVIALAMVPIDRTPGELFEWVLDLPAAGEEA